MKEQLLTCAEAQAFLRISRSTIYRLILKEDLRAVKVGNTYRIPQTELEHYLNKAKTIDR